MPGKQGLCGVCIEFDAELRLAQVANLGESHAVGGQHAGKRVEEYALDAQGIGDEAGVLAAGAAEAVERVLGDVVAALHGDLLDRVRHVLDGDAQEALGDLFRSRFLAGCAADFGRELLETRAYCLCVEGLVCVSPEDLREVSRLDFAEHHVAVGNRQRAAPPVARGPRIGAGRLGPDPEARAVELQDRAAAGGDGVDVHHRRAHAHAGDQRFETALELAVVMGDVGGGAAHVEADQLLVSTARCRPRHAHDAARRT